MTSDCSQTDVNALSLTIGAGPCVFVDALDLQVTFPPVGIPAGDSVFGIPEFLFYKPLGPISPIDTNGDGVHDGRDWGWVGDTPYPPSMVRMPNPWRD